MSNTPKERVESELSELNIKIEALRKFIRRPNPSFKDLSKDAQMRLRNQLHLMDYYSEVLSARLKEDFKNA